MRKLRILAVQTHFHDLSQTNAADWWRVVRPFQELQKRTDWDIDIVKGVISQELAKNPHSPEALREWQRIGMNYDMVFFSYNHSAMFYSFIAVVTRKFGHVACIDYDDNVLKQDLLNPIVAMQLIKDRTERFRIEVILKDIDSITVTNPLLKSEYSAFLKTDGISKNISVLPNYIDLELFKPPKTLHKRKEVTIGFFGSTSHQADLNDYHFANAISVIRKKYPTVRFEILGNFIPHSFDCIPTTNLIEGETDFYKWIKLWKRTVCNWDICVAPNRNTTFNKSRSNIKWQEAAAAKIPIVASDIGLYTDPTVFKAKTTKAWADHLSHLIEDESFRIQAGINSYEAVQKDWTIQGNWEHWRDAILQRVNRNHLLTPPKSVSI